MASGPVTRGAFYSAGSILLTAAILGCGALTWLSWQSPDFSRQALPFVGLFGVLFAVYMLGLRYIGAMDWTAARKLGIIIGSSVILRLILLPSTPLMDDDVYRYRWDGKVLASGQNPYAFPPESPALAHLAQDDPLYTKIGFRDIPAVYPPASMALFALGHTLTPNSIWGIKALVVMTEVVIIAAIIGLLKSFSKPPELVGIYAWNPLVLKEFANSGHHDAVGIAVLMAALWALATNRRLIASVGLAVAALVKPIILVAVPALWGRLRAREWLSMAALIVVAYLPFASIGISRLFAGMGMYLRHWEMNDSVFALLQSAFGGPVPSANQGFLFETNPTARAVAFSVIAIVAVWAIYDFVLEQRGIQPKHGPVEGGMLRAMWRVAILLVAVLAITPTMDPWYLCWLVPFLCFFRWGAGILMTGTVALSYLYYWQGRDQWWIRPVEYLPVLGWAAWEGVRTHRSTVRPA